MDDDTLLEMMQQNNPSMFNFIRQKINKDIEIDLKNISTPLSKKLKNFN